MTMMSWRSHRIGVALASWLALPAIGIGKTESFSEKIKDAATISRELAEMAPTLPITENQTPESRGGELILGSQAKVPFASQVKRYTEARPWTLGYIERSWRKGPTDNASQEPAAADALALRALLKDENPELRGLAAEALATLDQPEDAPRLGELLDDSTGSAPILAPGHMGFGGIVIGNLSGEGGEAPADTLDWSRCWQPRPVSAYAKDGLKLLTGRGFSNKTEFQQWWARNAEARHCLWYWQLRIQHAMAEVDSRTELGSDMAERVKQLTAARTLVARRILEELKQLPPEVEAKVRLLAANIHAGGAPITGTEEQFWPEAPELRLSPDRLLDLLDRKGLWNDVDWDASHYNLLAERLGLWADVLFKPQHVDRLRAALEREKNELWWSGKTALIIGIARLHPAAKAGNLDEVGTRDQILRDAAVNNPELFARGYCAMELVRAGLPENAGFLQRIAFQPTKDSGFPDVMQSILQALARPPFDKPKRDLLVDIALDERFKESWTRANSRMGNDMNRVYAIWAINAHAGRTLITDEQKSALVDPARSAAALEKVRTDIKQLFGKP
jgi:hypothetical protein